MDILYKITDIAEKKFGISAVKPYQILVIHRIVEQDQSNESIRNQLVILPTGTGKSLCFLVSALLCRGITIIVFPLLSLMNDQLLKLKSGKIDCVCLRGGQTNAQREQEFQKLENGTKIVITNPETLNQKRIIKELKKFEISLLVCDEAHVISMWGKNFRPAYRQLKETVNTLKAKQVLAFTATADNKTIDDIRAVLFNSKPLIVKSDSDRENIIYRRYPAYDRFYAISELLTECEKPAIVFCPTRALTQELSYYCRRVFKSVSIFYYHAGLSQYEREWIEKTFLIQKDSVLFATSAYGMGVDKKDIRTVIHYKAPTSILDYLQQSGRAGRDGKKATSWVVTDVLNEECNSAQTEVERIFNSQVCRRFLLLKSLDQTKEECSGCDVCLNEVISEPEIKKTVLKAVKRNPYKYTVDSLAALLTGLCIYNEECLNPFYKIFQTLDCRSLEMEIKAMCRPLGQIGIAELTKPVLYPKGTWYNILTSILERVRYGCFKIVWKWNDSKGSRRKDRKYL